MSFGMSHPLTRAIYQACLLEASARKAGNVHPAAAFEHLCYQDFVNSAEAVAPILAQARQRGIGTTILDAVTATRQRCGFNTNLGIILLLAPLAAVPEDQPVTDGIEEVLGNLTRDDAAQVYAAIRLAAPRGLGTSGQEDVSSAEPAGTLREVMALAADRDAIAFEYAHGFPRVLREGVPLLMSNRGFPDRWEQAVIRLQLELMAASPDTDIARKCGTEEAHESAVMARRILGSGWPATTAGASRFRAFDAWLRSHGSQRNPGTTADLVTACLFVAIRERILTPPEEETLRRQVQSMCEGRPLRQD